MGRFSRIQTRIQHFILSALFIILVIFVIRQFSEIKDAILNANIKWLPCIIITACIANVFKATLWAYSIKKMGTHLSYKKLIAIWHYAQIGVLIPGSIWMMVGRAYLLRQEKVPMKLASYSIGIEQVTALASSIFVALITPEVVKHICIPVWIGFILAPLTFIILRPHVLGELAWKLGIRKFDLRIEQKPSIAVMSVYFLGNLLNRYLIGFIGILILKLFITEAPGLTLYNLSGMVSASFAIGYLSFLTPGGLGVKEGILVFLFSKHIPTTAAVIVSLSTRVWSYLAIGIGVIVSSFYIKSIPKTDHIHEKDLSLGPKTIDL